MLNFIRNYLNQAGADGAAGGSSGAAGTGAPAGSGAAPAAGQAAAGASSGAAAPLAAPSNLVSEAKPNTPAASDQGAGKPPAAAEPGKQQPATAAAAPSKEAMQARLIAKGGNKEDVEKLSDADLAKQYEAVKPPEYTDFKLPDTVKLDDKLLPDLKSAFADEDLKQDQVERILNKLGSKVVSVQSAQDYVKDQLEAGFKLWSDTQTKWQTEVKADPEVGGANLDKSLATIASGIDMFAKDAAEAKAIRQAFAYTGAGNNPAIVRLLARAFAPYMEGGHAEGGKPAGQKGFDKTVKDMYPSATGNGSA